MQPIGKLHQQHAHVVRDGEQQLAQVFCLLGFLGDKIEFLQLGQAFDQHTDVVSEQRFDLGTGRLRVLDRVVQQGSRDGCIVELQVR